MLLELSKAGKVKKVDYRYNLHDLLTHAYSGSDPPPYAETIEQGVLTVQEAYDTIQQRYVKMHLKTVQRKVRNKEIPSFKFGSTYRIPTTTFHAYLEESLIPYRPIKRK